MRREGLRAEEEPIHSHLWLTPAVAMETCYGNRDHSTTKYVIQPTLYIHTRYVYNL